jgi:hypothetical protein
LRSPNNQIARKRLTIFALFGRIESFDTVILALGVETARDELSELLAKLLQDVVQVSGCQEAEIN